MRRTMLALTLVAVLAATGCGGADDEPATTAPSDTTVTATDDGVLVDGAGRALYVAEQERDGQVRCVDACAEVWLPLKAPASGDPTGPDGVTLSTVGRPDGSAQVTLDGAPLYRFAQDPSPGEVTGDGVSDDFGGHSFIWQAARVSGAAESPAPARGGYGY